MRFAALLIGILLVFTTARAQEQRLGLRLILVHTEAQASNVLARLSKGESFESLARELSVDPSAPNGGFVGLLDLSDLRSEFQSAVAGMSPGQTSAIVKLNTGFVLLYKLTDDETKRFVQLHAADELARKRGFATALHEAVKERDKTAVERLLAAKADFKSPDMHGWTALQRAAQSGQTEIVRLLLDHGADLEERDAEGFTPIITAAEKNAVDTVALMIRYKANVNARTNDGRTALYQAVHVGSAEVAKLLLVNGAHVDSTAEDGVGPIAVAAFQGHVDLIPLLVKSGGDVNAPDKSGRTPLHFAASASNAAVTRSLLSLGAQINSRNGYGCTPLFVATTEGSAEVMRTLISAGADVNVGRAHMNQPIAGITALHAAVNSGDRVMVQMLLDASASVDAKDSVGQQPLMIAVAHRYWEIADLLITHGANVHFEIDVLNAQDFTQIRLAADRGYPFAQFALAAGYQFGAPGFSRDMTEARSWYAKAAAQGHPGAANGLGWMYQYGLGGNLDIGEAARWYRVAADKGDATAQNNLGSMLQNLATDREAIEWFRKAAAQHQPDAVANLAVAYARGRGVKQDYETAASLFRRAAELGNQTAAAGLANLHLKGLGVKKDAVQAYAWFLVATRSANPVIRNPEIDDNSPAIRADMEAVASRLSPTQISTAERWATQWIQTHPRK